MLWDTHMHTQFSGDSEASPESMIEQSIRLGLKGICFTDHLDYDYPVDPELFLLDLDSYDKKIHALQQKYRNQLPIRFGIEIGLQPHLANRHQEVLSAHDFDFVIGSSHVVHGFDPYYPTYFEGKTEQEAYLEYFTSILENIQAFSDFDVYGHIDYVVRYGPNKNENYSYAAYADIIDEILRQLIQKGRGIEINTGGFKYGLGHPNPTEDIIARYRELGGEIITIGADGHKPEHIAYDFAKVPAILKAAGFRYYTVFKNRKPEFISL
ncbi:MAG: histidinol-phosphatase HisJ family protein [Roseburia sp.]